MIVPICPFQTLNIEHIQISHIIELSHVWWHNHNLHQILHLIHIFILVENTKCPPFLQKRSPLFGLFRPVSAQNPAETAPNLGPTEEFSKKPTYDCSSAMNDEVSGEKVQLPLKTAVPRHFCWKTARVGQKMALLRFLQRGIAVFRRSCSFSPAN